MIRVLVVDDSAFMRKKIREMLESDPDIKVVGIARDGYDALNKVRQLKPDLITLDIEMPKMDGISALSKIMSEHPTPVIMVSTLAKANAEPTLQALSMGAVDFVTKPSGDANDLERVRKELILKARMASKVSVRRLTANIATTDQYRTDFNREPKQKVFEHREEPRIITTNRTYKGPVAVIGSSTGGPNALQQLFSALSSDFHMPMVVVQHMPPYFTATLAKRLDNLLPHLHVKEAEEGDVLSNDLALVAPGGKHLLVDSRGRIYFSDQPPVHGVKPAVDVTLMSLVEAGFGKDIYTVILTGMGFDGARAALEVKKQGGYVLAQNEETCVVYGMPRATVELGAADEILPLQDIGGRLNVIGKSIE